MILLLSQIRTVVCRSARNIGQIARAIAGPHYSAPVQPSQCWLILEAGPFRRTIFAGNRGMIRPQALVRLAAPENPAATALLHRNAVVVKHLLRPQVAAPSPARQACPGIVRHGLTLHLLRG